MEARVGRPPSSGPVRSVPIAYRTSHGFILQATIEEALERQPLVEYVGKIDLIFTSPPFPLNRKKAYGNKSGAEYLKWIAGLAPKLARLLTPKGSIVMEIGNAWEPGQPTMSTLPLRTLLRFMGSANLHLCQQFVCHNPSRLPTPAQWVTIERIRIKDSFTHVWWMARTARPKASNRRVLIEYSQDMLQLLKRKKYNAGARPSGHVIGEKSFLRDNGGAIPPNVLRFSNTTWNARYDEYCFRLGLEPHPARMASGLVEFFVKFLTNRGDLVLDPFAGSNTTGAAAEALGRDWISVEPVRDYVRGSRIRFRGLVRRRTT